MAYDLIIKNGMVVDGSGFARYRADVGVKDGTIVEIGHLTICHAVLDFLCGLPAPAPR